MNSKLAELLSKGPSSFQPALKMIQRKLNKTSSSSAASETDHRGGTDCACFHRVCRPIRVSYKNQGRIVDLFEQQPGCHCTVCLYVKSLHAGMNKVACHCPPVSSDGSSENSKPAKRLEVRLEQKGRPNEDENALGHYAGLVEILPVLIRNGIGEDLEMGRHTVSREGSDGTDSGQHHLFLGSRKNSFPSFQCAEDECASQGQFQSISVRKGTKGKQKRKKPYSRKPTTKDRTTSDSNSLDSLGEKYPSPLDSVFVDPRRSESISLSDSDSGDGHSFPLFKSSRSRRGHEANHFTKSFPNCPSSPSTTSADVEFSDQTSDCWSSSYGSGNLSGRDSSPESCSQEAEQTCRRDPKLRLHPWQLGDIVLGHVPGNPWLPCMVCDDAEGSYQQVYTERGRVVAEYHVRYFGTSHKGWLRSTSLRKYEGKDRLQSWAFNKMREVKTKRGPGYQKKIDLNELKVQFGPYIDVYRDDSLEHSQCLFALSEAENARNMSCQQRLQKYAAPLDKVEKPHSTACGEIIPCSALEPHFSLSLRSPGKLRREASEEQAMQTSDKSDTDDIEMLQQDYEYPVPSSSFRRSCLRESLTSKTDLMRAS